MIEPCGWRWNAIGMLRTRAILRSNMKSIAKMLCFIIRNRASGSAVGTTFKRARFVQPNKKRFTVRRIIGNGDLWVTEFVLTYDGIPSYAVSIMEFREGLVVTKHNISLIGLTLYPRGRILSSEWVKSRHYKRAEGDLIGVNADEISVGLP